MLTYLSMGLGLISLIAFMVKCNKQRSIGGVFIKNITSLFFLFTTATAIYYNQDFWKYGILILIGGVFGMLGDIYLDQKWVYPEHNDNYLNAGFVSFGIGHFFYIAAIFLHMGFGLKDFLVPVIVGIVVAAFTLITEKPTKCHFGKFKAIVTVYCLVIGMMTGSTLWGMIQSGFSAQYIVLQVAAILFLLSDIILSSIYFGTKNTPVNFVINHTTYYFAQFLIAFSVFLVK
ncbi:MAG: lysoplasmalogenase [Ruminococcaceae bacterium]|nr:lysoplasmalogenase [Oscillospiraceae bacterium]